MHHLDPRPVRIAFERTAISRVGAWLLIMKLKKVWGQKADHGRWRRDHNEREWAWVLAAPPEVPVHVPEVCEAE